MSVDLDKAVKDLKWIADRVNGVLSLKDVISDWNALDNQVKTLTETSNNLRDTITKQQADLNKAQEETARQLQNNSDLADKSQKDAKSVVSEAKKQADVIIAKANADAKSSLSQLDDQKTVILNQIGNKQSDLDVLNSQISISAKKLIDLQTELTNLKSKF